ncbi:hypothetical protein L198_07843 [Cryptococcus wingfieldii CBS 7118]|uniref:Uncharacterized protein n=1 Tax=Cryptococcus wingfieldii CBS 7118 TaxID=1295528 RepID=A0A1E3HWP1_9TREE|nr:hypothetical protein L198_07843 [Cryptococcus wingfieldii CBS 7118]ODN80186.1 hypothetical protein L198_07843 [Cryptococcus wingfieldii CBS 7118]
MSTTQLTSSALRTLVPLEDIPPLTLGKTTRASSFASSTTSTSSIYSRAADDLIDRFATHQPQTPIHLWSGGNVRLGNMDLTLTTHDAELLMHAMNGDERFDFVKLTFLDEDREEWKISFMRSQVSSISPPSSVFEF